MAQISSQPPSTGNSRPASGMPMAFGELGPNDALAQADRVNAETLIRSTGQVLAGGAAIKDLDGLIQRNIGYVSHADLRAGRLGSNVLGDIISTVEQAKGGAPFNWSAATPQQIDAYLTSKGIMVAGYRDGSRSHGLVEAATDRQANSGSYARGLATAIDPAFLKSVGLNDATGRALAALGFHTPEQLRQIVGDAHTLGLAPNAAALDLGRLRKAEGARTDEHVGALKRYGDALTGLEAEKKEIEKIADPKVRAERLRLHEEKRREKEEELKAHREQRVLTPDGKKSFDRLRDKILKQDRRRADYDPHKVNFGEGHEERRKDDHKLGSTEEIEVQHKARTAILTGDPAATDDVAARLARRAQTKRGSDPAGQESSATQAAPLKPASATQASDTPPAKEQPKAGDQRQAVHSKAMKPTV